jgi:hypothetical protein
MRKRLWVIVLLMTCAISPLMAADQQSQIFIGTTALSLGMPEKAVMNELSQKYRVEQSEGQYVLWSGREIAGSVRFCETKLCHASAEHYTRYAGDPDLFHALYRVLDGFSRENNSLCAVSTKADGRGEAVFILCGATKWIKITSVNLPPEIISISEEIGVLN